MVISFQECYLTEGNTKHCRTLAHDCALAFLAKQACILEARNSSVHVLNTLLTMVLGRESLADGPTACLKSTDT